jgi:hypothetical protein
MKKGAFRNTKVAGVCLALFWLSLSLAAAETSAKGNIVGFLYGQDGSSPLEGGVVKLKNLMSGATYLSTRSDSYGIFRVEGVDSGFYTYGVLTGQGDFNAENIVGLKVNPSETAKLSIALSAYEKEVASAVAEVTKEQEIRGESLVGMIAAFDPASKTGIVQVTRGLLRHKDRIHAKGKDTDFYQEVGDLMVGTASAKRVLAGQTGALRLDREAHQGDLVYVVKDKRFSPLFLAPLGIAAVIAGNSAVTYTYSKIKDKSQPASPDRNN